MTDSIRQPRAEESLLHTNRIFRPDFSPLLSDEDRAYAERLASREDYATYFGPGPDGHVTMIKRLMFHWTLMISELDNFTSYSDHWCYESEQIARAAVLEWSSRDFAGEPLGWHRHPRTDRRLALPDRPHPGWGLPAVTLEKLL